MANNYTDFRVSIIAARRLFSMMDQPPAVVDRLQGATSAGVEPSHPFPQRPLRVRRGRRGLEPAEEGLRRLLARHRAGPARGPGGPQRHGQVHGREPAAAPVGSPDRRDPDRQQAAEGFLPGGAAEVLRRGVPARVHLQRDDPRQHPAGPPRRHPGGGRGGGPRRRALRTGSPRCRRATTRPAASAAASCRAASGSAWPLPAPS